MKDVRTHMPKSYSYLLLFHEIPSKSLLTHLQELGYDGSSCLPIAGFSPKTVELIALRLLPHWHHRSYLSASRVGDRAGISSREPRLVQARAEAPSSVRRWLGTLILWGAGFSVRAAEGERGSALGG